MPVVDAVEPTAAMEPNEEASFAQLPDFQRAPVDTYEETVAGTGERVVELRWAKYPATCLDVSHQQGAGSPGTMLQIWDCTENRGDPDRFIVPSGGSIGPIRPVAFPTLCLSTEDPYHLTFSSCDALPEAHKMFAIRVGDGTDRHHIHLAADMTQCIDIPDDEPTDGHQLGMWHCSQAVGPDGQIVYHGDQYAPASPATPGVTALDRRGDELLIVEAVAEPVDCRWSEWGSWSSCSEMCGTGHESRYRAFAQKPDKNGLPCNGAWSEVRGCNLGECPETVQDNTLPLWCAFLVLLLLFAVAVVVFVRRLRRKVDVHEDDDERLFLLRQLQEEDNLERRRDQQGWLRVEGQLNAREREEALREDARRQRLQSQYKLKEVLCPAGHTLTRPSRPDRSWKCDMASGPGGCRCGIQSFGNHAENRFRCETCDFDLCDTCVEAFLRDERKLHSTMTGEARRYRRWGSPARSSPREETAHLL